MSKNVVRIQTEMFRPGAVVEGPMIDIYLEPPRNSTWWPRLPAFTWLEDCQAGPGHRLRFDEGGFFYTFAALGAEIHGRCNGDVDLLLQQKPAAELFARDLGGLALSSRQRFEQALRQACWATLALCEVDMERGEVDLDCSLELEFLDEGEPG